MVSLNSGEPPLTKNKKKKKDFEEKKVTQDRHFEKTSIVDNSRTNCRRKLRVVSLDSGDSPLTENKVKISITNKTKNRPSTIFLRG